MTQDEIICMAREADLDVYDPPIDLLQRFAKLVAQHEREQCAKVCEAMNKYMDDGEECAAAIRARGQA
jgi:phosphoserine phosphatase